MEYSTAKLIFYIAFFCTAIVLLIAPFIPTWKEFISPTDFSPLPISSDYATDILYFAQRFKGDFNAAFAEDNGSQPAKFIRLTDVSQLEKHAASAIPVFAANSIHVSQAIALMSPLFTAGDFRGSDGCTVKAIYACGSLAMGKAFQLMHWAHADGTIFIQEGSVMSGRMSSTTGIQIGPDSCFERLSAPIILLGPVTTAVTRPISPLLRTRRYANLPRASHRTDSLYMVHGDCNLTPRSVYHGSLIVKGDLVIGEDTCVVGDIKVTGNILLSRGVKVDGAITSERNIETNEFVRIKGPVIVQRTLQLGSGVVIGTMADPTSITSNDIVVSLGVTVHGTIRARHIGVVLS